MAIRLEAIPSRLEAIVSRSRLEALGVPWETTGQQRRTARLRTSGITQTALMPPVGEA